MELKIIGGKISELRIKREHEELTDAAKKIVGTHPDIAVKREDYHPPTLTMEAATYRLMGYSEDASRIAAGILKDRTTDIALPRSYFPSYLAGAYEAYFRCLRMGLVTDEQLAFILSKNTPDIAILSRIWENSGPGEQTEKCWRLLQKEINGMGDKHEGVLVV